ncbi:hypothetical protein RSJ42_16035 [Methanosarcina hadiensis]
MTSNPGVQCDMRALGEVIRRNLADLLIPLDNPLDKIAEEIIKIIK